MITIELSSNQSFSFMPREVPSGMDMLQLTIRNEAKGDVFTTGLAFIVNEFTTNNLVTCTPVDLIPSISPLNKYELFITNLNNNYVIYRGKLLITASGSDIQNYSPSTQKTPRFK